jgi:hypothetical protein
MYSYKGIANLPSHMTLTLHEFAGPPMVDSALLRRAIASWSDEGAVSDDDVKAVCDVFRGVFNVGHAFQGAALQDALLLYPVEDEDEDVIRMFAVQLTGSGPREFRWVHWELSSMWSFGVDVGLDDMLAVLAMGARLA